jgi:hypothetical protein
VLGRPASTHFTRGGTYRRRSARAPPQMFFAKSATGCTLPRRRHRGRSLAGSPPALRGLDRDQRPPAAPHEARSLARLEHVVELAPRQPMGNAEPEDAVCSELVEGGWRAARLDTLPNLSGHDRSPKAAVAPKASAALRCEESGSPRRFGAMATHLGGGRAGGSQVRDRTERGGRSCARERFNRPRVRTQIVSPIQVVNAPRSTVTNEGPSRPRMRRSGMRHRRRRRRSGGSLVATTACFARASVTRRVTRGRISRVGSRRPRHLNGRGLADSVNKALTAGASQRDPRAPKPAHSVKAGR